MIGLAPVAASPLAAKAASDSQIAKLVGIVDGAGSPKWSAPTGGPADWNKTRVAASEYMKFVGIPDFVREQVWRESQYVSYLDPDLAAKRSWSMSVKVLTQRQRNFERRMEQLQHSGTQARAAMAFQKLTGWDWPW
jgi:hypothetical protein